MCDCDYDPPEFYDRGFVKGRKAHRCCECLANIPIGETQEYVSGKWDGYFAAFRTCMQCVETREAMQAECFAHEHLVDDVSMGDHNHLECVREFSARRDANYERLCAARLQAAESQP